MRMKHFASDWILFIVVAAPLCVSCRRQQGDEEAAIETRAQVVTEMQTKEGAQQMPQQQKVSNAPRAAHTDVNMVPLKSETGNGMPLKLKTAESSDTTPTANRADPKTKSQSNALATFVAARDARKAAQVAAQEGKLAAAYTKSLSAWESLQEFRDDQKCRTLADELLKDLENYGEKLTIRQSGLPPNILDKPVRFE